MLSYEWEFASFLYASCSTAIHASNCSLTFHDSNNVLRNSDVGACVMHYLHCRGPVVASAPKLFAIMFAIARILSVERSFDACATR